MILLVSLSLNCFWYKACNLNLASVLCSNPHFTNCHNHVMMLLLCIKNFQWLTYKMEAKLIDLAFVISIIWSQFIFWVFIFPCSLFYSLFSNQTKPSRCSSSLGFCSCHPHLHTSNPPSGPSVSVATSHSHLGMLLIIFPWCLVRLCKCLQVWKRLCYILY